MWITLWMPMNTGFASMPRVDNYVDNYVDNF